MNISIDNLLTFIDYKLLWDKEVAEVYLLSKSSRSVLNLTSLWSQNIFIKLKYFPRHEIFSPRPQSPEVDPDETLGLREPGDGHQQDGVAVDVSLAGLGEGQAGRSTLIGRAGDTVLWLVGLFMVVLRPPLLCHKDKAQRHPKHWCLYDTGVPYNRFFPCMETTYHMP